MVILHVQYDMSFLLIPSKTTYKSLYDVSRGFISYLNHFLTFIINRYIEISNNKM